MQNLNHWTGLEFKIAIVHLKDTCKIFITIKTK